MVENVIRSTTFTVFEENGKVGLKDEEGQILIPATYDAIGWSNGKLSIVDKVVGYQSNGLWGLINTSNKQVTPAEFLELRPGEGSFLIAQKKSSLSQRPSFGIINTSGKTVILFQYDGLHLSNMRAVVMSRSGTKYLFGLIDLSHKVLIPIQYQSIYSLGSLRYAVENFDDKTAIFSDEGSQVTEFIIDSISAFKKDYAIVYQSQRQGLIDRRGQMALEPTYGSVQIKDDGSFLVREIDSWFFLDGQNTLIRQYQADVVNPLSPEHYAVASGGKLQLTNNNFEPLHETFFSSLAHFRDGIALFRKGSRTGVIGTAGKIVIPAEYHQLLIDENVFLAQLDIGYKNRWVILDSQGKRMTEKHYEYIGAFNGKFFPVRNRGFWGAVNSSGEEIITCVHDSLVQQSGEHIVVKFKGEYGIINLNANWIVTPQVNPLELLNDETYFEFNGKTTFLRSFTGNIIYFSDNHLEFRGGYVHEHLPSGAFWTINMNGIIIDRSNQPDFTEKIFLESEGLRAIHKDGKYGFIDDEGRLRIANRYEDVRAFSDGRAAIRIRNKWGFIDHQENLVVQPVYDQIENFNNGFAIVTQHNLSGLIDENGKIILPLRYDEIILNSQKRFGLKQGTLYGLADASGTIVIHPKYDEVTDTANGYAIVQRDGRFGLITLRGVSTIPLIYDGLTFDVHHNQYMGVKKSPWKTVRP
ncbi:MAG: WG repeat-containing protein [Cyclobacteriaceae bacterium]